jgi:hypothetical protein
MVRLGGGAAHPVRLLSARQTSWQKRLPFANHQLLHAAPHGSPDEHDFVVADLTAAAMVGMLAFW